MIEIGPSRRLRAAILLVWVAGAALAATRSPLWGAGGLLLWSAGILLWLHLTFGLNGRRLVLRIEGRVPQVILDGVAEPLSDIRPGIITPALATALLVTPRACYAIMASMDNVPPDAHWRLRRLLVDHKVIDAAGANFPTR